jgi:pimeloyl-ACP methyl ester carboxylesterase
MQVAPKGSTFPEITHHEVELNGTRLHYVSAGNHGSPVLLVHGFPETWWTFREVIPLLAASHRVSAVDLRGLVTLTMSPATMTARLRRKIFISSSLTST